LIGWVLLLVALGLAVVLALVFIAAVRARMAEREELVRASGADREEIEEARRHRPAVRGWLTCSGIAALVAFVLIAAWVKGCQAIGRRAREQRDLQMCERSLAVEADSLGAFWDKHRRLPGAAEFRPSDAECPLGNYFIYVGHLKINLEGRRVLIVELQSHPDGSRRALVADRQFIEAGQPVQWPPGAGSTGMAVSGAPVIWAGWSPYRRHFQTMKLDRAGYEGIRAAVESGGRAGP
jgi:hypothetical protein